ncbi:MAG TPA: hypothetical protein VKA55_02885 [Gammaproteobacteria bacterium]|nr:hypothetical protein [Gammaproteobacteria bacterium]
MDRTRTFTRDDLRSACRLLERERPSGLADCDECAEYRLAVCHFPDWLEFPLPGQILPNPER